MNSIDRLIKIFSEFPGIGPKQARRFVYFLITRQSGYIEELKKEIEKEFPAARSFIRAGFDE